MGLGYANGTGALSGWQTWYSNAGYLGALNGNPNYGQYQQGQGNSYHVTSSGNTSATLIFNGTTFD
jgi:hypothetical protein